MTSFWGSLNLKKNASFGFSILLPLFNISNYFSVLFPNSDIEVDKLLFVAYLALAIWNYSTDHGDLGSKPTDFLENFNN